MSRTEKEGKRRRGVALRPATSTIGNAMLARHAFGSTEKIRRRNRKTWTRLVAKRRRVLDRQEVADVDVRGG